MKKGVCLSLLITLCFCSLSVTAKSTDIEAMYSYRYFFKPAGEWLGDPMPVTFDQTHYLFYLLDNRNGTSGVHPVALAVTNDLVSYNDLGVQVNYGYSFQRDYGIGTGSVVEKDGIYYMYYTGHNQFLPYKGPLEVIMRATSSDQMQTWQKDDDFLLFAPDNYNVNEWRDPYVFYNSEVDEYWMLVATRKGKTTSQTAGVIALFASSTLNTWEHRGIFYEPNTCFVAECPQLMQIGSKWYLLYNEFLLTNFSGVYSDSAGPAHYAVADSSYGPFVSPTNDTFDSRAYAAVKMFGNNSSGFFTVGWVPTRENHSNRGFWGWGGNAVVHSLTQQPDGSLSVNAPAALLQQFSKPQLLEEKQILKGEVVKKNNIFFLDSQSAVRLGVCPERFRIDVKITIEEGTQDAGMLFCLSDNGSTNGAMYIRLDAKKQWLRFDAVNSRNLSFVTPMCFRPMELRTGQSYDLTVIAEGSVLCVYVENSLAMSVRMYGLFNSGWGLFCGPGSSQFSELQLLLPEENL